uniref:Pre-mRNA-splicing factor SLU7 n=1 Tax=Glossina pallidipes TaxID=7398 RepID=A0A1B0ACD7_GLOPL
MFMQSCDGCLQHENIAEYLKVEEAKRQLKAEKWLVETFKTSAEISDDDSNKDKYDDEIGTKVDSKQRITVRNLRIREDTAKYLRNSYPNSTHYDPETISMRDNPYPQVPAEESEFDGEILFALPQTQQNVLLLNCSHGRLMVRAEPTKLQLLQKQ